ncbi:MAG: glycosyltransferase family 2 protein [Bacteroidales bacterium]|jgi:glycosyltransferase involved in cell wall biosynthesis|nr:glycosyltransferase family 2 protein [Bacteroidales bacterium]
MNLSIIIPLLNEQDSIEELTSWIKRVVEKENYTYEILLIDDGSWDKSWDVIERLSKENKNIKGIKFRRNYGKSAALNVGFEHSEGDVVITMDADLQDSPDEIPSLYSMIVNDNYDLVSGWKKKRYDSKLTKNIPSKLFNKTTEILSGIKLHDFNCGLKAYRKEVVKSIEIYGEMHRYIPVIAKWAGFRKIGEKVVKHNKRLYGKSKFGVSRFLNGYLDLMSILFVSKFSKKPMHFFGLLGSFTFLLGFLAAGVLGVQKIVATLNHNPMRLITNSPYFYIALVLMIIGTTMFLTGFIAELIGRNSPSRNHYLIEKKENLS